MELRHLRYFVTVVEEQSLTKAAEKLFIAQPPLTRQIKKLEEELGIDLFLKGSRPLKVTEAGLFFLPTCCSDFNAYGSSSFYGKKNEAG